MIKERNVVYKKEKMVFIFIELNMNIVKEEGRYIYLQ